MKSLTKTLSDALLIEKPSLEIEKLFKTKEFQDFLPELEQLKQCQQDPDHHPEGSVWNHTMLVIDEASELKAITDRPLKFMYAALFHDIGKPQSESIDSDGKIHSYDHDSIGADMIKALTSRLELPNDYQSFIEPLVRYHMRMHWLERLSDKKVIKMMLTCDMVSLLCLNKADTLGRKLDKTKQLIKLKFEEKYKRIDRLSQGQFGKIIPIVSHETLISESLSSTKDQDEIELKIAFDLQLQAKSKEQIIKTLTKRKKQRL